MATVISWPTGNEIYGPDDDALQHWAFIESISAPFGFIDAPEFMPAGATTFGEFDFPHVVTFLR